MLPVVGWEAETHRLHAALFLLGHGSDIICRRTPAQVTSSPVPILGTSGSTPHLSPTSCSVYLLLSTVPFPELHERLLCLRHTVGAHCLDKNARDF